MSTGYDYTAADVAAAPSSTVGAPIPGATAGGIDLMNMEIADTAPAVSLDEADAAGFGNLPPGNYLLKVAGFGPNPQMKPMKTFLNGKAAAYNSLMISVRLVDVGGKGSIFENLFLPPSDPAQLVAYNEGTNAKGTGKGFVAGTLYQFLGHLIPGSVEKGKPLSPIARKPANWINRLIWAQVEMEKEGFQKEGIDPKTDKPFEPLPPRPRVRLRSYREYVEGQPCPYHDDPATAPAPAPKPTAPAVGLASPSRPAATAGPRPVDPRLGDV